MLLNRILKIFTSLRLTVVCLCLALLLVFIGTLAQVDEGLYQAQNRYFRSLLIYWTPKGSGWNIPVFPGGYLVGGVLLINLLAAHAKRFQFTKKKIGIFIIHAGIILLLLGQFATDLFQVESHMWLNEGQSKNYSDSSAVSELAVVDTSNPDYDEVVAIPESVLARKGEIHHAKLSFTLRVKNYFQNSEPRLRAPMVDTGPPQATQGIGQRLEFTESPATVKMDSRNIPAAIVEVVTAQGSLGTWVVSNWAVEEKLVQLLRANFRQRLGDQLGEQLGRLFDTPQQFTYQGRTYQMALRPVRFYKPFNIELLKFSHDLYKGTEIPKNFSSRIRLRRPDKNEDREVLIYMNNPLRYAGETFFQAGFDDVDPRVTILQVVRNPGWLTPYLSCVLVALGLIVQFMSHLIGFAKKRRTA
ncbi:MAG: cytochrome c biogenesis protein ResB [Verrucomicrobia bacterium]|nr:cytochrome c biogenesis protein ResB [Verrucomicrobiota bacterium]